VVQLLQHSSDDVVGVQNEVSQRPGLTLSLELFAGEPGTVGRRHGEIQKEGRLLRLSAAGLSPQKLDRLIRVAIQHFGMPEIGRRLPLPPELSLVNERKPLFTRLRQENRRGRDRLAI